MTVLTTSQVSRRWSLPVQRVRRMCEREVFPGAFRSGNKWLIPETSVRLREGALEETPT